MVLERLTWHVICASHTSYNFRPFMLISSLMLFVLLVHANIFTDVVLVVGHDLPLVCGVFHFICRCSFYESVGEVLKFTIATAHRTDVVGES